MGQAYGFVNTAVQIREHFELVPVRHSTSLDTRSPEFLVHLRVDSLISRDVEATDSECPRGGDEPGRDNQLSLITQTSVSFLRGW